MWVLLPQLFFISIWIKYIFPCLYFPFVCVQFWDGGPVDSACMGLVSYPFSYSMIGLKFALIGTFNVIIGRFVFIAILIF